MDDILDSLAGSLRVSTDPNNTSTPHPRFSQYKLKDTAPSQDVRRKRFLEAIKDKRFDYLQYVRSLAEGTLVDNDTQEDGNDQEDMDWTSKPRRPSNNYKNQLMLSEWLVEVPSDFAEEWLMVPCPIGKRSLIVSCHGKTCAYAKSGYRVNIFPSHLPGGNRKLPRSASDFTMLDCIFNELERTYYVLDMMCWKCQPIFDSATDCRFFLLQSRLSEIPELQAESKLNPFKFVSLPSFACDAETLRTVFWSPLPFQPQLDGLLFYSKQTHYSHGSTPLVGWLKPHMVLDLLGIKMPDELCVKEPTKQSHREKRRQGKRENDEQMVTS